MRPAYIVEHLLAVARAVDEGVPVSGYLHTGPRCAARAAPRAHALRGRRAVCTRLSRYAPLPAEAEGPHECAPCRSVFTALPASASAPPSASALWALDRPDRK